MPIQLEFTPLGVGKTPTIVRNMAMHTIKLRDTKPALALAVHWRALVRRICLHTSCGWAQHIVDRWRVKLPSNISCH